MYVREVKGQKLNFTVSGLLWAGSLIMMDVETKTEWSHILGLAKKGKLEGTQLEIVPSSMTNWETWSREHPKGTVLDMDRTAGGFDSDMMLDRPSFVLAVVHEGKPRAWSFFHLEEHPCYEDKLADEPVVVVFDDKSGSAMLFGRTVGDDVLSFEWKDGKLLDTMTKSEWEFTTGQAVAGPLKGKQLHMYPAFPSFLRAWQAFHPKSKVVGEKTLREMPIE